MKFEHKYTHDSRKTHHFSNKLSLLTSFAIIWSLEEFTIIFKHTVSKWILQIIVSKKYICLLKGWSVSKYYCFSNSWSHESSPGNRRDLTKKADILQGSSISVFWAKNFQQKRSPERIIVHIVCVGRRDYRGEDAQEMHGSGKKII